MTGPEPEKLRISVVPEREGRVLIGTPDFLQQGHRSIGIGLGESPWVVSVDYKPCGRIHEDQGLRALRLRRSKEEGGEACFAARQDDSLFRADGVEHGPSVVRPLLPPQVL